MKLSYIAGLAALAVAAVQGKDVTLQPAVPSNETTPPPHVTLPPLTQSPQQNATTQSPTSPSGIWPTNTPSSSAPSQNSSNSLNWGAVIGGTIGGAVTAVATTLGIMKCRSKNNNAETGMELGAVGSYSNPPPTYDEAITHTNSERAEERNTTATVTATSPVGKNTPLTTLPLTNPFHPDRMTGIAHIGDIAESSTYRTSSASSPAIINRV